MLHCLARQLPMRMRVKGQALGTNTKMESRWVAEEREWDHLCLRDVRSDRATYSKPIPCSLFMRGITFSFIHNKVEPRIDVAAGHNVYDSFYT